MPTRAARVAIIAFAFVAVVVGAYRDWLERPVERGPGVLVSEEPEQTDLKSDAPTFHLGEYEIAAEAAFHFRARLLGRERYHFHREADLSPVDFAIGWGPMSDSAILSQMEMRQGSRYFQLRWRTAPLAPDVIFDHLANVHVIPADATVARAVDRMRVGEIVELDGYLVRASAPDGWSWKSSLTRTDRGAGACELMWVQQARSR